MSANFEGGAWDRADGIGCAIFAHDLKNPYSQSIGIVRDESSLVTKDALDLKSGRLEALGLVGGRLVDAKGNGRDIILPETRVSKL